MVITAWETSSAGILPAVPRASRPRRGGRRRPPDSRRDGGATTVLVVRATSGTSGFRRVRASPALRSQARHARNDNQSHGVEEDRDGDGSGVAVRQIFEQKLSRDKG